MITQAKLKELFNYNPETGLFTRRIDVGLRVKAGAVITNTNNMGYLRIIIDRKAYAGHRMAWLYMFGELPKQIDHKNGIKTDNRIANLRLCTTSENNANRSTRAVGVSGYKGILYSEKYNSYVARLAVDKQRLQKTFTISKFESKEKALQEAHLWLESIRKEHHNEFAKHG
jgi:hypothetical protein